jgi:hypothetical protein
LIIVAQEDDNWKALCAVPSTVIVHCVPVLVVLQLDWSVTPAVHTSGFGTVSSHSPLLANTVLEATAATTANENNIALKTTLKFFINKIFKI